MIVNIKKGNFQAVTQLWDKDNCTLKKKASTAAFAKRVGFVQHFTNQLKIQCEYFTFWKKN